MRQDETLATPCLWVPAGQNPSPEWLAAHPDRVRLEATFVPDAPAEPPTRLAQAPERLESGLTLARSDRQSPSPGMPGIFPTLRLGDDLARYLKWQRERAASDVPEPITQPSPDTVEMARPDRHDSLPPWLQKQPARYQTRARRAEADIVAKAGDGRLDTHHLISRSVAVSFPDLMASAARAGWEVDETENLILLPADGRTQHILKSVGELRPLHNGGHPAWIRRVRYRLSEIEGILRVAFGPEASPVKDMATLAALRAFEQELRMEVLAMGAGQVVLRENVHAESTRRS